MASIADNPADQERTDKIKQLSQAVRQRRMAAVDILLAMPQEVSDILESELWTLRGYLTGQS